MVAEIEDGVMFCQYRGKREEQRIRNREKGGGDEVGRRNDGKLVINGWDLRPSVVMLWPQYSRFPCNFFQFPLLPLPALPPTTRRFSYGPHFLALSYLATLSLTCLSRALKSP